MASRPISPALSQAALNIGAASVVGLALVLFGPWLDIGFEYATVGLCSSFLADESTAYSAARDLVPAQLVCSVGGREVATDSALVAQIALTAVAVLLVGATAVGRRTAPAIAVLALVAVGGYAARDEFEGFAVAVGPMMLAPFVALAVTILQPEPSTSRAWIALTIATWIGYATAWIVLSLGVSIGAAAPVGVVLAVTSHNPASGWLEARRSGTN